MHPAPTWGACDKRKSSAVGAASCVGARLAVLLRQPVVLGSPTHHNQGNTSEDCS
jgi:hypothetical protein